jgi:F-type H+-transporting ATPase subunit b
MLIDWFTVGAQALNFLVLVWLLKRFLYRPILHAIDTREKRIAAELSDAGTRQAAARRESDEFRQKNEDFDRQRAGLLSQATAEVEVERQRLLAAARQAADDAGAMRREGLRRDARALDLAIRRRTQTEVFAIVRKTLIDLASASLEERLVDVFIRRLRALDGDAKATLDKALAASAAPAVVRSVLELPAEQRAALQDAVDETFTDGIHLQFVTAPELVSGIELSANGQKVAWSIEDYLVSLEASLDGLLNEKAKPEVTTETAAAATGPGAKPEPAPAPEPDGSMSFEATHAIHA